MFKPGDRIERINDGKVAYTATVRADFTPGSDYLPVMTDDGGRLLPLKSDCRLVPSVPTLAAAALAEQVNALGARLARTEAERDRAILERDSVMESADRRVQEAHNGKAEQIAETSRLARENMRLRAAVASAQTHLGNLVRDIHQSR